MTGLFDDDKPKPQRPNLDLSRFVVGYDRWDRAMVQRLLKEIREFNAQREKLVENQAGDLGYDVWQDLFNSLIKVRPHLLDPQDVRPGHQVNHMVMDEAMKLKEHEQLRIWTHNDEVGSALACITMEPDMEILYDKVKEAQKAADEAQKAADALQEALEELRDADDIFEQWTQDHDPEKNEADGEQASDFAEMRDQMEQRIEELMAAAQAAGQAAGAKIDQSRATAAGAMQEGLEKAIDEAKEMAEGGAMWGTEPGVLKRLDPQKRLELARKMNTPKFKKIASKFGSMVRFAFDMQRRKVDYLREEIVDIEIGRDLTRVLAERLVQMADDEEEDFFWADFAEGKLPQYKMTGQENLSKGGIIFCHDGSGSMSGDPEVWAKAVGLCLLHIAKKSNPVREFVAIQFGSAGQIRIDDFREPGLDPDKVMDFAEFFYGGGTDFQTPLTKTLELLEEEHQRTGAIRSDIVFATDGIAGISDAFMKNFKETQARLDFKVWGIFINGAADVRNYVSEPLNTLCDGRVCSIKQLSDGTDAKDVFGGV